MRAHVWTNAAFLASGAYLVSQGVSAAGTSIALLGICSGLAHHYRGRWWSLDWAGMYVALLTCIAQPFGLGWMALISFPIVVAITWRFQIHNVLMIAPLFVLAVVFGHNQILTLSVFSLALTLRQLTGDDDDDFTYDVLHGSWHLLAAFGFIPMLLK